MTAPTKPAVKPKPETTGHCTALVSRGSSRCDCGTYAQDHHDGQFWICTCGHCKAVHALVEAVAA